MSMAWGSMGRILECGEWIQMAQIEMNQFYQLKKESATSASIA
jgi:hypothetical protein